MMMMINQYHVWSEVKSQGQMRSKCNYFYDASVFCSRRVRNRNFPDFIETENETAFLLYLDSINQ